MQVAYLKKYIKKYYKLFLVALCFLSFETACDLLQPALMSKIVDVGIKTRNMDYVLKIGAMMLGLTVFGAMGAVVRNNISNRVSQSFGAELRFDLFRKIQSLSYQEAERLETPSLITRLTNDVTLIQNFTNSTMRISVKAPLMCLGSIIMAFLLDRSMGLILLAVVALVVILIYLNTHVGFPLFRRVQKEIDRLNGMMREYLSGIRVIKAFHRFDYEEQRFAEENKTVADIQTKTMQVSSFFAPAIALTVNLGIIAVLWLGARRIDLGTIEVGKIIAFTNYMTQIVTSLLIISRVFNTFVRARVSAERIGEVMTLKEKAEPWEQSSLSKEDSVMLPARWGISFANVSFSYKGDAQNSVLKQINFECAPGMKMGVIGSTGAGKTTLINLIPRFYEPTKGKISFSGLDSQTIPPKLLREKIGIVPQKVTLFTGTILENLRWGGENADFEHIIEAAKAAQAHEFIMAFPEQYDTLLGQGGVNLSGGQKQRISIARALVKKPSVLILDDCTSAVDSITEEEIMRGISEHCIDSLQIIVTQRIAAVLKADWILVLDNGELCGQGTHGHLLKNCPVYQEIYLSQFGKEEG